MKAQKGKEQMAYMQPLSSEEESRDVQLEAIFRTYVADLYRYIYRQVRHAVIAEDLTSAVFLKALRWLQQERGPESVKGWLYATARSVIADHWHEHTRLQLLPLEAAEAMPMLSEENSEAQLQSLQARTQRLLDGLPERYREILILRYFQGYSAAEIGQVLGLSANYVRVLQLRALRRAALLETKERSVPMQTPIMPYDAQTLRVLELAKEEARLLHHSRIGTEHLLLGILHEGSAAADLIAQDMTLERMRGAIIFIFGGRQRETPGSQVDLTARTQKVLALAGEEAQRLGETAISPYHLLLAILREGQGVAAQLLYSTGVRLEWVGKSVRISILPDTGEEPITLPLDFQEALQPHPAIQAMLEELSYRRKRSILDRIEQAEGEAARHQQIEQTIERLQRIHQIRQQHLRKHG